MHTVCVEQHELITHTEVLIVQLYVTLSHGSKSEHKIPGAQRPLLVDIRYS